MNIASPFIKRKVMTILVMLTILVFGIIAYKHLPVSDLPSVDFPTIAVSVSNPGSNPETMAATCATPLEREFMTIDGINSITSNSSTGNTSITIQFSLDKSMTEASVDVEAAINRAIPLLPNDLPYNPTYQKVNPAAVPIVYFALSSESMTLSELYDYSNTYIGQRMSMINGVSQVFTGGAPYAARIQVNPQQLAAMQVGLDEAALAIKEANVDHPTGVLFGDKNEFTINVDGELYKADGYSEIVIKNKDGSLVKIAQIGRALNSLKNDKYYLQYQTKDASLPCVILGVKKQSGVNTIEVITSIKELLSTIKKQLPSSLKFHKIFDQSDYIIAAVDDVKLTLLVAFILVVLIIFLYLGKFLNTIIPALALPISIAGTFAIMYLLNFSIDILSLLAITLSIGFLVDDAIVVLENNVRHVQQGKDPLQASLEGSKEISITVLSMTLCLIAVFIPMLFMGGIVGKLFNEFAFTICSAVLISGFISLSLTPLLCSKFIPKYSEEKKKGFMERAAEKLNKKMLNFYKKTLSWVFEHKKLMVSIGFLCIGSSVLLFSFLPKEFLPNEDMGFLQGYSVSQDGTSPFEMARYQKTITDIISKHKDVESVVGIAATGTDNEGFMYIKLKPFTKRGPLQHTINSLMKELYPVAGVNSYISTVPLINLQTGYDIKGLYQYSLTSINQEELNTYAELMLKKIKSISGFTQVSSNLQITQPQLNFEILRDRAYDLNVSADKIENLLGLAYSEGKISTIHSDINQYDVIMETLPKYYRDPTDISKLYVRSKTNDLVPLEEIVKATESIGPLTVNHLNGLPAATISFNLKMPLSSALADIENIALETLPPTISGTTQGTANVFKESFSNLTTLFIITFFVIYIILGILYEDFIHPLTVMSTLAPATFGGLFMLFLFGDTLSIYSFVGLILLIGIVMKNGIMMVDFANANLKQNMPVKEAIFDACFTRFRPIMMTTFAALMGAMPIAFGIGGASAQSRRPLGIVIVGGLIISQILTLYLTPITYYLLQTMQEKIKAHREKKSQGLG